MVKDFLFKNEVVYYNFKGINIKDLASLNQLPGCYERTLHYEVFISNIRIIFCILNNKDIVWNIFHHNINTLSKVEFSIGKEGEQRVLFIKDDKYYNMQISEKSINRIKEFLNINTVVEICLA